MKIIIIIILLFIYGGLVVRRENVVDITLDDAGLASADVSHNEDLEEVLSLDFTAFVSGRCLKKINK